MLIKISLKQQFILLSFYINYLNKELLDIFLTFSTKINFKTNSLKIQIKYHDKKYEREMKKRMFEHLDKNHNGLDAKKVIAFQLGQAIGLHEGVELYTKSTISLFYEELKPFLYRQEADPGILNSYVDFLCDYLYEIPVIEDNRLVSFDDGRTIDLVHEEVVMDLKNIIFDDFSER